MSKIFSCSFISEGNFFAAGTPIEDNEIRKFMLKYELSNQLELKPDEVSLRLRYNQRYSVDADGFMRPSVGQQAAQLEALAQEQEWADSVGNEPPNEAVAAAIKEGQELYRSEVERQIAQAEYSAKQAEAATDVVREEQDENVASGEFDTFDTIEEMPKPRQMRRRYVRRGVLYRKAKDLNVKLKRGEPVFIRNGEGEYERIGNVGHNGSLPVVYVEEDE